MKRILMMVLVICVSVAFVSVVNAQVKPADKAAPAAEKAPAAKAPEKAAAPVAAKAQEKKFAGVIVSADVKAKTFVAKDKKAELTFDAATAKFAPATKLEELKAGDAVAVEYVEKDGKNIATAVAKAPAKAEKKAEEAKAPAPAPAKK